MRQGPTPAGPGRDEDPAREPREPVHTPDPMTGEDWQAWCDSQADRDEPPDSDEEEPYHGATVGVRPGRDRRRMPAGHRRGGRRVRPGGPAGPGWRAAGRAGSARPGPARLRPAGSRGIPARAAGFAAGMLLDTMPGCGALAGFAAEAAGDDDRYHGASDDEVAGVISAWDRIEAHVSARKHAAVAELIRRRPGPGSVVEGPAQMPTVWDEFTVTELALMLGESRGAAEDLLDRAHDLEVKLPGPRRHSGTGYCASPRRRSSSGPPRCWIRRKPAPPRRWCWTGRGG